MEKKIMILSESGLHARPASQFVKEASKMTSEVFLIKDGKEYNGKSMMSILGLGAKKGTELTLRVPGAETEMEAFGTLCALLESSAE